MAKKFLTLFMVGVMSVISALTLVGCKPKKQEIGMFICQWYTAEWNVLDLSEEGKQQSVIIMPKTILGEKYCLCDTTPILGVGYSKWRGSDNLERLYINHFRDSEHQYKGVGQIELELLGDFPKLEKILTNFSLTSEYINYENIVYTNCNYVSQFNEGEKIRRERYAQMADVQFMWNYDDAPNYGYYWVDDIEDGEKIEIIPDVPERDGYIFGGWYCESECINEWSFDTPIKKQELTEYREWRDQTVAIYPHDYVTFIYAKWIKGE